MRSPSTLRVGLADSVDPRDMQAGSGASASLLAALNEVVAEAVPLSGQLPPRLGRLAHLSSALARLQPADLRDPRQLRGALKRSHSAAQLGRPTIAARELAVRRRLAAAGALDGIVQRGSEMRLPSRCRVATLEDSTVLQARSYPWPHLQGLTERDFERYAARQRRVYEAAVACCCSTHWVAESIVRDYGIPASRVFTVGLGQNHALAPPSAERDWSTPRCLFVGVDWQRKNGPAVLAAFARLREQHPRAQLDLVGGHPTIEEPGVVAHGRLSIVDPADRLRLAELYRRATAFVMPSLHEPAGIVYVEAGGAGIASIGTTQGGAPTMIGPGGLLVDPHSPEAILAAMLQLADPPTAQRLGQLAQRHAALFTWRKVAERMIRALAIPGVDHSGLAEFL